MTDAAQVHTALLKLNQHTAAKFVDAAGALEKLVSPEVLSEWCVLVLRISQSGWHSWEVLNYYLEATPVLVEMGVPESLLQHGEFGISLLGSSTEPASRYFGGIALIPNESAFDKLRELELTGSKLQEKFPPATGLVASFYHTSFDLLARDDGEHFSSWLLITELLIAGSRQDLARLYSSTSELTTAPAWDSLAELAKYSIADTLVYIGCHDHLCEMGLRAQQQLDIQTILKLFATHEQSGKHWLTSFCAGLKGWSDEQVDTLLWMTNRIANADLSIAIIEAVDDLPLENRSALQPWMDEGVALFRRNAVAGRAWLGLESASSNRALEKLAGTALLADHLRVLQLFVESFLGRRLIVQTQEQGVASPHTDGLVLKLPESVSLFETQAENFQTYKSMLLHQLGYFEFGIFDATTLAPTTSSSPSPYTEIRKSFSAYGNRWLAEEIFLLIEHGRIDAQLAHRYPGTLKTLSKLKSGELESRLSMPERQAALALAKPEDEHTKIQALLESLVRLSLDEAVCSDTNVDIDSYLAMKTILRRANDSNANVSTTLACMEDIYRLIAATHSKSDLPGFRVKLPEVVGYRGMIEPEQIMINLHLAELDDEDLELLSDELEDSEEGLSIISMLAADDLDVDKLKQGELDQPGTLLTDLDEREIELDEESKSTEEKIADGIKAALEGRVRPPHQHQFQYDEWDFVIGDYRRNWCTLHEYRVMDEDPAYVDEALSDQSATAASVRRQLNKLRPEMLTKVKGVDDGEELDIERTIEHIVDKRAGVVTEDRIYVEKQRKQRDVAALFLLDMSASTDDAISPEMSSKAALAEAALALDENVGTAGFDDNDFLHDGYMEGSPYITDADKRKIIDVEKEAAILMAEALKNLGDQYAICGFSGYGRDNVDFYVCKDFEEPYGLRAKGKLGGIKACRSTRMGPAIRHATKMLVETGCKTKALIIISDGYPQDYDYGKDRSSRDYGIKDTTRALVEARQRDVQGFCLTVDQSGHDYLREMCPDKQYLVIQDVAQLPGELSKIYKMITG